LSPASYFGAVPVVSLLDLPDCLGGAEYATRQIVPPVSSAISSEPSRATASAAGRPHTSAGLRPEIQKPAAKFS
jgi:hypothetical protein